MLYFVPRNRATRVFVRCCLLLRFANTQKRQDIRPFPLAFGEMAKGPRYGRPAAESFFHSARVIFPLEQVRAPRRYSSPSSHGFAPVYQEFTILELHPQLTGFESRGPDGIIPFGKEFRDGIPGDSCAGEEFCLRWRATKLPCNGAYGI